MPSLILRPLLAACCLLTALPATAALHVDAVSTTPADLLPGAIFDPDVPSPAEVLGSPIAARPYRPEEVLAYFHALAATSPHATLREYARSHEGRPLVTLVVSGPEAVADPDAFRADHRAWLAGDAPAAGRRAVAWLAYGIHGDELSSTDAAVVMAYWLTAGTDALARRLRDRLVVLIDPNENPDGRARYLAQITSYAHRRVNPDQDDLSHRSVWPWGRGNHYLFDLNRDWFSQVHPESRRSGEIAAWLPQLLVDSHEMGANSTYLFPPPRHPYNPHLPESARRWELAFSADQAAALDARGYPYFNGEWNEEFFPGYGSSWCGYHGTVGILYEMSRTSGQTVRKRDGTVRTFAQAIEHQVTSSRANLTTLADHAAEILSDMRAARRAAAAAAGPVKAWILPPHAAAPGRTEELGARLRGQGIEVHVLTEARRADRLHDIRSGERVARDLPVGTLLVRLDQPAAPMIHALLDPHVPMEAEFLREEREYLERGKGTRLYEVTAWSLPLALGLEAYWSDRVPGGAWSAEQPLPAAGADEATSPLLLDGWNSVVFPGDHDAAPALIADLLQRGVAVRIAEKPLRVAGREFARGAVVIRREGNDADVGDVLAATARRHGIGFVSVPSFRPEAGPDLGGSHMPVLVPPRVGVLAGMPVSPTAYGAVWHLLDQTLDLRFTALDVGRFGQVDLGRYNVLVFPPILGGPDAYAHLLGPGGLERLRSWVQAGGTAVGFGGGARLLAAPASGLTTTRFRGDAVAPHPSPVWSVSAATAAAAGEPRAEGIRPGAPAPAADPYDVAPVLGPGARPFAAGVETGTPLAAAPVAMADWLTPLLPAGRKTPEEAELEAADERLRRFMPRGALLRVELHDESWLTHGLGAEATVMFRGDDSLVATPPATVAARLAEPGRLHLGGLLWPEAAARLAGTGYAVREGVGRGQVILFASEPAFRRWMRESERLLINAVLLGPGLGTRWSRPW